LFPIRDINPTRTVPIVTLAIIALNLAVFFLWQPESGTPEEAEFLYENAAIACELTEGDPLTVSEIEREDCGAGGQEVFPDKQVYVAAIISMFLHGGIIHLLGNMWFMWIFANNVEEGFGTIGFVILYLVTGLAATVAFVLANTTETVPLVGASGAIAGVLGSYLVLFPRHRIMTIVFFFFVPISALWFLAIWFFSQFAISDVGVAWEAHVGGFVAGVLITLPLRERILERIARLHAIGRVSFR
jgi:membrane associated rhomboid family serine protease